MLRKNTEKNTDTIGTRKQKEEWKLSDHSNSYGIIGIVRIGETNGEFVSLKFQMIKDRQAEHSLFLYISGRHEALWQKNLLGKRRRYSNAKSSTSMTNLEWISLEELVQRIEK